ncbi:MAG: glycosyltransferase family 4 protein, partial [Desulfobacterales bacterium]|nr:glycosyltransferase family 4 protein [Desulfobacterales bacterium]
TMKISWYSHYFTPEIGAPSARLFDLSRQWVRGGHDVSVTTCFPNHPGGELYPGYRMSLHQLENVEGITVHRLPTYITANRGFVKKLCGHLSYIPPALVRALILKEKTDIIIGSSPTFFAAMAGAGAALLRRRPFIMEVRDLWPAIFVELGVLKNPILIRMLETIELALYRFASAVVTVTESFRQNLISRGVHPDKVATIPNGADTDFWQPVQETKENKHELGLGDKFVVLYIGAHGISHGLASVLECANRLQAVSEIQFLFVGDGAEKNMLKKRVVELGLRNVTFHEPVDKQGVKRFYALADACLVPLRDIPLFDAFIPSKMFEIMAMSRPIVASLKGEAADIVQRSKSGIVIAPEDAAAMHDAILELYENQALCLELGENGRRFVGDNFSRKALADRYLGILEDVLKRFKG